VTSVKKLKKEIMKNPHVVFLVIIVAVALVFGGYLLAPSSGTDSSSSTNTVQAKPSLVADPALINDADAPRVGSSDAKEQIVVFSDFLCPYCQQAHSVLNDLLSNYPDDVSVVYRNYIVHEDSQILAQAAEAANMQGKYKEFADELFSGTSSSIDTSSDTGVVEIAQKIGLDVDKFKNDLNSDQVKSRIDKDNSDATGMNLGGTPSVFLNDTAVGNYNNLPAQVKDQLGR